MAGEEEAEGRVREAARRALAIRGTPTLPDAQLHLRPLPRAVLSYESHACRVRGVCVRCGSLPEDGALSRAGVGRARRDRYDWPVRLRRDHHVPARLEGQGSTWHEGARYLYEDAASQLGKEGGVVLCDAVRALVLRPHEDVSVRRRAPRRLLAQPAKDATHVGDARLLRRARRRPPVAEPFAHLQLAKAHVADARAAVQQWHYKPARLVRLARRP